MDNRETIKHNEKEEHIHKEHSHTQKHNHAHEEKAGGKTKKKEPEHKIKKEEAVINAKSLPISTKKAGAFCNFVKKKSIEKALDDLQKVVLMKKAVPSKGEFAHRKGKGIAGGIYATNTAKCFIMLVRSLSANATYNGLEDPIIVEAFANKAMMPYGRFGRTRKKRTHVTIIARERKTGRKK
ncbi:MAG: uL22 family ribosomal protein [Nanoarchaeota archaeon]